MVALNPNFNEGKHWQLNFRETGILNLSCTYRAPPQGGAKYFLID